jgi:hypothetical protein
MLFMAYKLLTYLDSLDLRFEALFLCHVFFFASLSTILITLGKNTVASCLSVISLNLAIDVLADFL